ncbi:MAG: hypothetical protein GXP16_09130 [Gammaproteobacteria bacterium]|nr:hypothetical protein [Gammaproteobacteria bacterium]
MYLKGTVGRHRGRQIAAALFGLVAILTLSFVPIPEMVNYRIIFGAMVNAAHGPMFAALACFAAWQLRTSSWVGYATLWLLLALVGMLMEGFQSFGVRDASWQDVYTNLLGATAGLAIWVLVSDRLSAKSHQATVYLVVVAVITSLAIAYPLVRSIDTWVARQQQLPVLFNAQYADALSMTRSMTAPDDVEISIQTAGVGVQILHDGVAGVEIIDIAADWRTAARVVIDIENTSDQSFEMSFIIGDFESDPAPSDRFQANRTMAPGQRQSVVFTVNEIATGPATRLMPMDKISEVVIFRSAGSADQFLLHSIRLES